MLAGTSLARADAGATTAEAAENGFAVARGRAQARVVKLYGVGVGLQAGYGTGIVVSPEGHVLTVLSILIDSKQILAVDQNGQRYGAEVVARDADRQLALLKLKAAPRAYAINQSLDDESADETEPLPPFAYFDLAEETEVHPGDWIVALGNPFKVANGDEPMSLAHGVLSVRTGLDAMRRSREFPYRGDVYVIDAITSNPGAPGSVVVTLRGEFVGMIGRLVVSNLTHTHFNYAIPRDVLLSFYRGAMGKKAKRGGDAKAARGETGIVLSKTGYKRVLPFVERVRLDSPAFWAGVKKDDLILSVNNKSVSDAEACQGRLGLLQAGQTVELVIRRDNGIVSIHFEAKAADRPASEDGKDAGDEPASE